MEYPLGQINKGQLEDWNFLIFLGRGEETTYICLQSVIFHFSHGDGGAVFLEGGLICI
uniref:Uncharacterized protein n=1 Tax=Solanum tuberosum TaxID=4113 RepID=M1D1N9_SOLTU